MQCCTLWLLTRSQTALSGCDEACLREPQKHGVILRERIRVTVIITTKADARPKDLYRVARGQAFGSRSSPSGRRVGAERRRARCRCASDNDPSVGAWAVVRFRW